MFKSLHAMRDFLEKQRQVTASTLGGQPLGVASCAVLGDLLTRVQTLTDQVPRRCADDAELAGQSR